MHGLMSSKRSAFAIIVLVLATVLCVVGSLTGEQWSDVAKLLCSTLLMSHTVSHAVEVIGRRTTPSIPQASVVSSDQHD